MFYTLETFYKFISLHKYYINLQNTTQILHNK